MKITIDTKEDSPADIRKVIALLSKMIEGHVENHSNIFGEQSAGSEPSGNAFANMFGEDNTSVFPLSSAEEKKGKSLNQQGEDIPRVIEY